MSAVVHNWRAKAALARFFAGEADREARRANPIRARDLRLKADRHRQRAAAFERRT